MLARRGREAMIPLSDGAGEVLAVGQGVSQRTVGERVVGCFFPHWDDGPPAPAYLRGRIDGMLAQHGVLPSRAALPLPRHMSFEEAATQPCAAVTAWTRSSSKRAPSPARPYSYPAPVASPSSGCSWRAPAACARYITSSSDEKLARARELGADETINYSERADWDDAVLDLTDGRGVDLVLEVGGGATFAQSMAATRAGGDIVLIGGVAGQGTDDSGTPLVGRNIRATRISVGSRAMFVAMNRVLALRELRPVIDRVLEFGEATTPTITSSRRRTAARS